MTKEHPPETVGTIRCTDCGAKPDLVRTGDVVIAECNCDERRRIHLTRDLPAGWSL